MSYKVNGKIDQILEIKIHDNGAKSLDFHLKTEQHLAALSEYIDQA